MSGATTIASTKRASRCRRRSTATRLVVFLEHSELPTVRAAHRADDITVRHGRDQTAKCIPYRAACPYTQCQYQ
uniref:Uncharacterized protein n=1 Tax=Tremella fuciformis TaxID=64657 RepID=D5KY00_9TREE|nr:unknown [Tremella fuciformis]